MVGGEHPPTISSLGWRGSLVRLLGVSEPAAAESQGRSGSEEERPKRHPGADAHVWPVDAGRRSGRNRDDDRLGREPELLEIIGRRQPPIRVGNDDRGPTGSLLGVKLNGCVASLGVNRNC